MATTSATDIVVVYQQQEFYVSTPTSPDQKTLPVDLLQCQLLSLTRVLPDEQILVSSSTGEVLFAPSMSDVTAISMSNESRSRFFLYSSTGSVSKELPDVADDWRQICTKSTFGDAAVVQPAFRAVTQSGGDPLVTLICEPCAKTCTTGFQRVSPIEWNASPTMMSRFVSDITLVAGDVDVAAPSGYTKLPVELNYSASGDYVYLCVKRGGPLALTQIHVLLEQRGTGNAISTAADSISCTPERIIEVDRKICGDEIEPTVRIGYDSVQLVGNMEQYEMLAITEIAVVVGDEPVPPPSYVKIARNLNEGVMGALPVFLYYRLSALGGFACDSGREHSDFGECLFTARHLAGVSSTLDLDEQRLTIPRTTFAIERRRGDARILKEYYRRREPGMVKRLQSGLQRAQSYENRGMQLEALKRIPVDVLQARAQANPSPMPHAQDELVKQLLHWFKHEFFTWMNQPRCSVCNNEQTRPVRTEGPSTAEEISGQAGRVEVYQCPACGALTRFPRYNDPVKLLDTRTGRCGEWANCFTLCCRAMGFEARYVLDVTDHVWTEVYSEHFDRWLHCDSCEDQLDCPLTYEVGWGKKLSYIFSFGYDEVVDTTRRYTQRWSEILTRRQDVSEDWLRTTISQINHGLQERQSPERVVILTARAISEQKELLYRRSAQMNEVKGRVSGSAEWKDQRNEAGKQGEEPHHNVPSTVKISPAVPSAEVLQNICKNLVIGCQFADCANPFCFTGRTRMCYLGVPSDVTERAAQALQIVQALSSMEFLPASLMMIMCPLEPTELRQYIWKNKPLMYLPLQDFPVMHTGGNVPLLDISGNGNHANNSQRCALRKPFRVRTLSQARDTNVGAGSQRDNRAFGMQLIGGKTLSVSESSLACSTNFVLSLLVRFDPNESPHAVRSDTVEVLAGRLGSLESPSSIEFRMHWKFHERQFSCELRCQNKTAETPVSPTTLLVLGGHAHVAIARIEKNAVVLYLNGAETLVLEGVCGSSISDVCIQGPATTYPSVATVISHVAMIPVKTLEEAGNFCAGIKNFVPAPPFESI
uniref:MABP domain-containing protein n=1 Tax=Peronospora matthiolae TaxID=2874970 RepID=A0AAV1UXL7_9STRA